MSAWKDEFHQRCRRVVGITDDSLPVRVELSSEYYSEETGGSGLVEIFCGPRFREWTDMTALVRELDAVEPCTLVTGSAETPGGPKLIV